MRPPTIDRPRVDLAEWVCRLELIGGPVDTDLVCHDTGLVVYTTPTAWRSVYQWPGGHRNLSTAVTVPHKRAQGDAVGRAFAWAKRHRLPIVKVDLVLIVSIREVVPGDRIWWRDAWREVLGINHAFGQALVRFDTASHYLGGGCTVHLQPKGAV